VKDVVMHGKDDLSAFLSARTECLVWLVGTRVANRVILCRHLPRGRVTL
jgi:hypothetical protein